jgi:peptidoglycan/LPS O-acetylase OafA/YrhL
VACTLVSQLSASPPTARTLHLPPGHTQFPLLDSLRALAALAILVVHVSIFSGAVNAPGYGRFLAHLDIGVPFFFLLSAFLLYRPFVAARVSGSPRRRLRTYARRRFLRIAPAYWLALTVAAIVPGFAGAFSGNWWVYYGLLQNYPIYTPEGTCAVNSFRCGIPVAWSLSVEVAFYAMLPLFALALDRLAGRPARRGWLGIEVLAAGVLAAISVVILVIGPENDVMRTLFFSPLGRGWWFGLGLVLAAISVSVSERSTEPGWTRWLQKHPGPPIVLAAALYAISCVVMNDSPLAFPLVGALEFVLQYLLVGVVAALVLLPAIFGWNGGGWWRGFLAHRTTTWLGLISYGIFLWQIPVVIGLVDIGVLDLSPSHPFPVLLLTTAALTIACAAVSYYALELPLMRRFRGSSSRSG